MIRRLFTRLKRSAPQEKSSTHGQDWLLVEPLEPRNLLATFTVNTTSDSINPLDLQLSLREAMSLINADLTLALLSPTELAQIDLLNPLGTDDRIEFNLGATGSSHTINLLTPLPILVDDVFIDGFSQGGSSYTGPPLIEFLGGSLLTHGIQVDAGGAGTVIQGLGFGMLGDAVFLNNTTNVTVTRNYFGYLGDGSGLNENSNGILAVGGSGHQINHNVIVDSTVAGIQLQGSQNNQIFSNTIGLEPDGTTARGNTNGVLLTNASSNTIGGNTLGNLISGNDQHGIELTGASTHNLIRGNTIGLAGDGNTLAGNGSAGILLSDTSTLNTIGGTTAALGNLISGNLEGIKIVFLSHQNHVLGNTIGLASDGMTDRGNLSHGIYIQDALTNTVGGLGSANRNLISGNAGHGVYLDVANQTLVQGNWIGLTGDGSSTVANDLSGVRIEGAVSITIGGTNANEGNLISGNVQEGISLFDSSHNSILNNFIGTNSAGTNPFHNGSSAVRIEGGTSNTIGQASQGNLLSANLVAKALLVNTTHNQIYANTIGPNATGTAALTNSGNGIQLTNSQSNTIGQSGIGGGNLISGNGVSGIFLESGSDHNVIQGNTIGLASDGSTGLGNTLHGIHVLGSFNTIGGSASTDGNVISGNQQAGMFLDSVLHNVIQGNTIGLDATGMVAVPNQVTGIDLLASSDNTIGGPSAASSNLISGNGIAGIRVRGNSTGNQIQSNTIGLNVSGSAVANDGPGIHLLSGANSNTIGSNSTRSGNLISGNNSSGILLFEASSNVIASNTIGLDATGLIGIGNAGDGISLTGSSQLNSIGGTGPIPANLIGANGENGIHLEDSSLNTISGNTIGLGSDGSTSLGNTGSGILLENSHSNTIGGSTGAGNLISGNGVHGIDLFDSIGVLILANTIGTTASGLAMRSNEVGVKVRGGSSNTIGQAGFGNLISGNRSSGIHLDLGTDPSFSNVIQANTIGLAANGTDAISNGDNGILVVSGSGNLIGGASPGSGNIIAGNTAHGIYLENTSLNQITSNTIGLNATGTVAVANANNGLFLSSSHSNTIGGAGSGNILSGNTENGLELSASDQNVIIGNTIGTNATGDSALPNQVFGIFLDESNQNTIGGTTTGEQNLISGNTSDGIHLQSSLSNLIQGNTIGTDYSGVMDLGNGGNGVSLYDSDSNTIGGTPPHGNLISGNTGHGVFLAGSRNNLLLGNIIGLEQAGTTAIGNDLDGVHIEAMGPESLVSSSSNTIGQAGAGNLISGNGMNGIKILGAAHTVIAANTIGLQGDGDTLATNGSNGIYLASGANSVTIGGNSSSEGNVVSGNVEHGVYLTDASNALILSNTIGLSSDGLTQRPNQGNGVFIERGATNTIGQSGAGNLISGNTQSGIVLSTTSQNQIMANTIGTLVGGNAGGSNDFHGILLSNASSNTIGGMLGSSGNLVSTNLGYGIYLENNSQHNQIQGNIVGLNAAASARLQNFQGGIMVDTSSSNTIGGSTTGQGNVVSGNSGHGMTFSQATQNLVLQNTIGMSGSGSSSISNSGAGISLQNASDSNTIGLSSAGTGNLISGNSGEGIALNASSGNQIFGNFIGPNSSGTSGAGNGSHGIFLSTESNSNTIGGTTSDQGNLISGNNGSGVLIFDSSNNVLQSNYIGVTSDGLNALANTSHGVFVSSALNNTIGGSGGTGNLISGNQLNGIFLSNSSGQLILGNTIGLNASDSASLSNQSHGISISGGTSNRIGQLSGGVGNVISGNNGYGIMLANTSANQVFANKIGTSGSGSVAFGNGSGGIHLQAASSNQFGSAVSGTGNVISGNNGHGVSLDADSTNNQFLGNLVGTNASGSAALANLGFGFSILGSLNSIGTAFAGNLISGNQSGGVFLQGTQNVLLKNSIGTTLDGSTELGNMGAGVFIQGTSNHQIGSTGNGNLISGNRGAGIHIQNSSSISVLANTLGLNEAGTAAIANTGSGVLVEQSSSQVTIGQAGSGNLIAGNSGSGIHVQQSFLTDIFANTIGMTSDGSNALLSQAIGIHLDAASQATIGTSGAGNSIASANTGILIANTTDALVQSNLIGTIDGVNPLGTMLYGVEARGSFNILIGGTSGLGNMIAFTAAVNVLGDPGAGVLVSSSGQVAILGNSIFSNGGLGIDHNGDGVTSNDSGDLDSGPNDLLNSPLLTEAFIFDGELTIRGSLNSVPDTTFLIEFFTNANADPSGFGEGETFLDSILVTTDSSGNATFEITGITGVSETLFLTSTSTQLNDGISSAASAKVAALGTRVPVQTSEFGNNLAIDLRTTPDPDPDPIPDPIPDPTPDPDPTPNPDPIPTDRDLDLTVGNRDPERFIEGLDELLERPGFRFITTTYLSFEEYFEGILTPFYEEEPEVDDTLQESSRGNQEEELDEWTLLIDQIDEFGGRTIRRILVIVSNQDGLPPEGYLLTLPTGVYRLTIISDNRSIQEFQVGTTNGPTPEELSQGVNNTDLQQVIRRLLVVPEGTRPKLEDQTSQLRTLPAMDLLAKSRLIGLPSSDERWSAQEVERCWDRWEGETRGAMDKDQEPLSRYGYQSWLTDSVTQIVRRVQAEPKHSS
ncbi:Hypothetical protein PBC10988_6270 [Planctomycetales bacterium 10988]|nr:Hypothetical protein PBC10988_6270 [Planctomycetales bacterium 10988]